MLIRQNGACFPKANRPRGAGARRQRNSRISTGQDCSQSQSSPCLPITRREFLKRRQSEFKKLCDDEVALLKASSTKPLRVDRWNRL
jgi:hypothetical protein